MLNLKSNCRIESLAWMWAKYVFHLNDLTFFTNKVYVLASYIIHTLFSSILKLFQKSKQNFQTALVLCKQYSSSIILYVVHYCKTKYIKPLQTWCAVAMPSQQQHNTTILLGICSRVVTSDGSFCYIWSSVGLGVITALGIVLGPKAVIQ